MNSIPKGYCQCGCGERTQIAAATSSKYGWVKGQPRRFLQGHHQRHRARPMEDRFWEKVRKGPDCWEWTAARFSVSGYGLFNMSGVSSDGPTGAHRVAWELTNGPIPKDMHVCHRCDNRICVNPDHLFLGTHTDNMADMDAKGRRVARRGENAPHARLTEDSVREIRRRHAAGETQVSLAEEFGVGPAQLNRIVRRLQWAHVE